MIAGGATTRSILGVLMGFVLASGCRQLNASHCGNQEGNATCLGRNPDLPYCNLCAAVNDGCVASQPDELGCGFGEASTGPIPTTTAEESSTAAASTDAVDSSSTGEPNLCGNGIIDEDEVCDGAALPQDAPDCESEGYAGGVPGCAEDCSQISFMTCMGYVEQCGNQEVGLEEDCDGMNLNGQTCDDFEGRTGDGLVCTDDCMFDTTACGTCRESGQSCGEGDTCCNAPEETCAALSQKCCVANLGLCSG